MERSLKEAVGEIEARLAAGRERRIPLMGLKGAASALALREAAARLMRPILVIAPSSIEAEALAAELSFFLDGSRDGDLPARRVHLLKGWEVAPFARVSPSLDGQVAEFEALFALLRLEAPLVVSSVDALMTRTPPRQSFKQSLARVTLGDRLDLDSLIDALAAIGYQRVPQVEEVGDFSVRGGIVDVYCPLYAHGLRLELEGDLLSSLRHFDPTSQRSLQEIVEATIIPARLVPAARLKDRKLRERVELRAAEIGLVRKEVAELTEALESGILFPGVELLMPYLYESPPDTVFDFVAASTLAWIVEPGRVGAEAARISERIAEEAARSQAKPSFYPEPQLLYLDASEFERRLSDLPGVEAASLVTITMPREGYAPAIEIKSQPSLKLFTPDLGHPQKPPSFEPLAVELKQVQRDQGRALMVVEGPSQVARLKRHLEAYDIEVNTEVRSFGALLESSDWRPAILEGEIASGTVLQRDGLYIYSEEDLFGEPRVRRRSRPVAKGMLVSLEELKPGNYVVHIDHGVGLYRGLKHLKVSDAEGDFLNLEYAAGGTMYVPVERINLVQRYIGAGEGSEPKLDRLGSGSWEKVKRRTRQAVMAMAGELLEIYAAREVQEGHVFAQPGPEYQDLADRFEFEETPDQQVAIEDVIRDMTRPKPMDRLICGDAGFGKTEVAMRAAALAVLDGRQVAVLVPTTVLAEQHWNTFTRRFKDFPVRVEMLSRFRTARENKAILEDLAGGKVDVVIGTHRLLQRDVEFKRLGLLIIDEEHRFGVADKERVKRLRKLVDALTLTSTPIPRTLHMAMLGIRDLSVIQTPPLDRQAIKTFVAHFDDGLLREIILRELNRGGQVFFVHNRVENIEYITRHLRALVPEAKIAVGHGQMAERRLEKVMKDFIEQNVNLLVCSAIIESGLDIPNANTMIINRADHFGLAQLYQLRGRVGRSRQKAYVYLLIPGEHIITRDARRRIEVLRQLVEVGGGFKLAIEDLEIRGAGNLLGREQSGHITEVGFELYTEMMQQAIAELRGTPKPPDFEPELQIGIPAYIPEDYVPDENERLILYRRMARAESEPDLDEMREEMRDRFGPVPALVENLLSAMNIRRRMKELMIQRAIMKGSQLQVSFHPEAPLEAAKLSTLVDRNRNRMRLSPALQLSVAMENRNHQELLLEIDGVLHGLAACQKSDNSKTSSAPGPLSN